MGIMGGPKASTVPPTPKNVDHKASTVVVTPRPPAKTEPFNSVVNGSNAVRPATCYDK